MTQGAHFRTYVNLFCAKLTLFCKKKKYPLHLKFIYISLTHSDFMELIFHQRVTQIK
jgi:hypothetical protein